MEYNFFAWCKVVGWISFQREKGATAICNEEYIMWSNGSLKIQAGYLQFESDKAYLGEDSHLSPKRKRLLDKIDSMASRPEYSSRCALS